MKTYLLRQQKKCRRATTGSLPQAGVLSRVTPRRNLEVQLPSEPYRYPRLHKAATTLAVMLEQRKRQNGGEKEQ